MCACGKPELGITIRYIKVYSPHFYPSSYLIKIFWLLTSVYQLKKFPSVFII
jgi:hypothetical protein